MAMTRLLGVAIVGSTGGGVSSSGMVQLVLEGAGDGGIVDGVGLGGVVSLMVTGKMKLYDATWYEIK